MVLIDTVEAPEKDGGTYKEAEREGFEPSVQLPVQRFSRPSHSTALASLLAPRYC